MLLLERFEVNSFLKGRSVCMDLRDLTRKGYPWRRRIMFRLVLGWNFFREEHCGKGRQAASRHAGWLRAAFTSYSDGAMGSSNCTKQSISWLFSTTWRSTMLRRQAQKPAGTLKIIFMDKLATSTHGRGDSTLCNPAEAQLWALGVAFVASGKGI